MTTERTQTKSQGFLEPDFWRSSAIVWGFSTGNVITLTLLVAAAYSLFHSISVAETVCGLVLSSAIPTTMFLIYSNVMGEKMRSPAEVIGGSIACLLIGIVLPIIFFPLVAAEIVKQAKEHLGSRTARGHVGSRRTQTGKEAFFSIPGSVARHAGHEVAATFFSDTKD